MNRYEITLDGTTFRVEILGDPTQDQVRVRVDGETFDVQVNDGGSVTSAAPPAPAPDRSATPQTPAAPVPVPATPNAQGRHLLSPLPGTVISLSVKPGQAVNPGDELLVIEAMKMNNRIRSPRGGTVSQVLVDIGQQVSHGARLLTWSDQ